MTPRRMRDESRHDPVTTSITTDATGGAHLVHHFAHRGPAVRVGVATGIALLFDDDDIGEPVNLAVCDEDVIPDWVSVTSDVSVKIRGVGAIGGVKRLKIELDPTAD